MSPEDVENNIPRCAWDLVAPNIAQDDAATNQLGFSTVQEQTEETPHLQHTSGQDSNKTAKVDPLSQLYSRAAKKQTMDFQEYCKQMRTLNAKQRHIVMYNRAWCKSYINANRKGEKFQGYRIFLSVPGGTGKSHVVHLIQRDMAYLLNQIIHHDDEQPIVLVTAPTGSAAYQIGGSTIDSALLLYEQGKSKPSWLKLTSMQLKLEHLMLLLTDEISMVGFTKFQCMNQTVCTIKGTSNGNWRDTCVLAVGDLYQLPPVGDSPVYMHPGTVHTLDDFAGNGWEKMQLHELSDIMWQKDMSFAECLNNIRTSVPEPGTRKQFPLTLAWAVTIHKCQGLTLPQIVVDMTPTKGTFAAGQAYVAFSRVCTHEKLHIIHYTCTQICISPNIELEMQRLRTNVLPEMPQCLFDVNPTALCLLHVNIGNLKTKLPDVVVDSTLKNADVISLNETHLSANDILTPEMMGLPPDVAIFCCDRNNRGGSVALLVQKKMDAQQIAINVACEIVAVKISTPLEMVILSVYRPPSELITQFSNCITQVIAEFTHMPTCIMGDFNEDVFMNKDTHCCSILQQRGFKQMVTKPTRDSGTIIDHVYASPTLNIEIDVNDC